MRVVHPPPRAGEVATPDLIRGRRRGGWIAGSISGDDEQSRLHCAQTRQPVPFASSAKNSGV